MTILLAPDKFKSSLSASEVCAAMARACRRVYPGAHVIARPLADGGEGTLDILRESSPLKEHRLAVTGPLRRPVDASYLLGEGKAYIVTAKACGLQYAPKHRRDPGVTTTIGVGELIDDALARGATEVYLFLGGSATNDCGAGMAGALGYRFFSDRGHDFIPTGNSLGYTARIDAERRHFRLAEAGFVAVTDVDNPLLGEQGATMMYAQQKGARPEDLPGLEAHMEQFADLLERDLSLDVRTIPGGGAAGGLGAGARAFLNAGIRSGIEVVLETVGFGDLLAGADLVLTGEGKIDEQTAHGKVVSGVGRAAAAAGVPCLAFGGTRTVGREALPFLAGVHALTDDPAIASARAMAEAAPLLEELVYRELNAKKAAR